MSRKYVGIGIGTILILFVVSSLLISASLHPQQAARATAESDPSWALPYPTGTRISIGSFGLHGDNFQAITDDTSGAKPYTLTNQKDPDALDFVLEPEVSSGVASTPTMPVAAGKVLAVQKRCHVVLIDHGSGWWSVYVHLANITVQAGQTVKTNTPLGYANTLNPDCNEHTDVEHTHISLIKGSDHAGTYVSLLKQSLCGHQVLESTPGEPKSAYLEGLVKGTQIPFTVPQCQTKGPTCAWAAISSPNVGTRNMLHKIDALATDDIWAVGNGSDDTTGHAITLTEHWNGSTWNIIASPNRGSDGSFLASVVATSKSNVFAIGKSYDHSGNSLTLIEHWNGTTWMIMSSPNRDSNDALFGATALSQKNIWAVGSYFNISTGHYQTLTEHWDGTQWSIINSPNIGGTDNTLSDVHAVASNDIWAVGYTGPDVAFTEHHALIEHWDGRKWNIVSHPASQLNGNLVAMAVTSASNIWAVGQYLPSGNNTTFWTLIEHWDGTRWTIVPGADIAGYNNSLADVTAISPNNIWAVGTSQSSDYQSSQTLVEHWNGAQWNSVTGPNPDPTSNSLSTITRIPGTTNLWAAGNTGRATSTKTLTEFHC